MSLFDQAVARALPAVPKPVVQVFSRRYIAGSTLTDAVRVVGLSVFAPVFVSYAKS